MGIFGKTSTSVKINNKRKISIEELVGKKYNSYYKDVFEVFDKGENKRHFNIYALIFSPYWYIYKRMTFFGISIIGLQVVLFTIAFYLTNPMTISLYCLSYLLYLRSGFYGEYDYYKRMLSYKEFSNQIDDKFKDRFLNDKSGDDLYMTICWVVGTIIIYVLAYYL